MIIMTHIQYIKSAYMIKFVTEKFDKKTKDSKGKLIRMLQKLEFICK